MYLHGCHHLIVGYIEQFLSVPTPPHIVCAHRPQGNLGPSDGKRGYIHLSSTFIGISKPMPVRREFALARTADIEYRLSSFELRHTKDVLPVRAALERGQFNGNIAAIGGPVGRLNKIDLHSAGPPFFSRAVRIVHDES